MSGLHDDAAMPNQPVKPEYATGVSPDEVGAPLPVPSGEHGEQPSAPDLSIIASKIEPPIIGGSVLTRPRLVGWLDQQKRARVMLVSAEAGYGKSTLLGDFSGRTDSTCLWYRLETSDGDWITFLSHLVAAVRRAFPGFGRPTEALLRHLAAMGPSREVVVGTFLSDLGTLGSASLILILDDYHLVEDSEDVRVIMARLLERAPATMRFVLAGRGKPNLPLGRLAAQGRVAELTTSDLRFTRSEIEELFGSKYGQPLGRETCDIVERRTEGWAASLQLVSASIAASRPSEVGQFIEALSGAQGPIYDFLAEEVLSRLSPLTQRVLIHASLIDRVTPRLVSAALSATADPVDVSGVEACMHDVEVLGLLSHQADAATGVRIHPLLRQFLEHQLAQHSSPVEIRSMHHAVARCAEENDWLVASKHFALAGQPDEAMRVLGAAASQALGTGAWGAAAEVVASMPDTPPPPAVEVIKARALTSSGRPEAALSLLRQIDGVPLDGTAQALVGLTKAAALHTRGESESLAIHVTAVAANESTPSPLREVAEAWRQILLANDGGSIAAATEALAALHSHLRHAGLHYYAGVTLHNFANAELASGRYQRASQLAKEAIGELSKSSDAGGILASTKLISAAAMAELGEVESGVDTAIDAATGPDATADAIADAAYMCAVTGRLSKARSLLGRFDRGDARGARELSSRAQSCYARMAYSFAQGDYQEARVALADLGRIEAHDIDARSRTSVVVATMSAVAQEESSTALASSAIKAAESQGAWRWMSRARILDAVSRRDGDSLATWVGEAEEDSALGLLEMADVVASAVDLLPRNSDILCKSIVQAPARWLPALGRQVAHGPSDVSSVAAALIARFGSMDDATVLRNFDRAADGRAKRRGLVTKLIRRVSPTVRVHDLGPSSYEIGNRQVTVSETRRKAAALLLYLVTRSGFAASREQVMESLWPDQTPKSGLNSLHQTLFFLRRDIEPWYEEGSTADYVRMESDLVYLDPELFQVDSVAFTRQCADILAAKSASSRGPELLRLYKGRFAPEFEYEEWAEEWRTQAHGAFLHLTHSTSEAMIREKRYAEAVEVLSLATSIDVLAYDLRAMLVASLAAVGSVDAAQAHYKSMASLHVRDMGVPAPLYEDVVTGRQDMT